MGEGDEGERRWQKMKCWVLAALAATLLLDGTQANSMRLGAENVQDGPAAYQNSVEDSLPYIRSEDVTGDFNSNEHLGWSLRTVASLIGRLQSRLPLFAKGGNLVKDDLTENSASTVDDFQTSDSLPSSSTSRSTSTTTIDPMDAYCEVACEEGIAGPECDCPGHPVG